MAEAIAGQYCAGGGDELFFGSAGVAAMNGGASSPETLAALRAIGITFEGRSTRLTTEMVQKADLVLCMTNSHVLAVQSILGPDDPAAARVHLLDPSGEAIADPIGMGQPTYDALAKHFVAVIPPRVETLLE
jgi:protein-tyrosine-phosphatase